MDQKRATIAGSNKATLLKLLQERTNLSSNHAAIMLNDVLGAIEQVIKERGELKLRGFGEFRRELRKGRSWKLPSGVTGQSEDRMTVKFFPSDGLCDEKKTEDPASS